MSVTISTKSLKSVILFIIQFLSLLILGITGKLLPKNNILLTFLIISLLLALWSMSIMKFHFNGAPEVLEGMTLQKTGPYKYIRHPMYTSLVILGAVLIINDFSFFRLIIYSVLFFDLVFKMHYEEIYLTEKFPEYTEYKKQTKKIIPMIF